MTFSHFMVGVSHRALMAADGAGSTGSGEQPVVAAPAADAAAAPAAPAAAESAAPASEPGKAAEAAPAAPAAAKAAEKEFAPSLLDEAAKPTPEPKTPEPAKDAAKSDDGKAPAEKEPAAADAKPDPAKALEAKPDPAKPADPPAPIEYAFTYPEGVKPEDVDTERMGAFTGVLNELRAAPEVGQKLLNLHLDEVTRVAKETEQRITDRQWEVFANTQKEWREQVMADPELGGSRHATAVRTVMSLIDAFNTRDDGKPRSADIVAAERKELLDVFRMTGVANNPSFLRLAHWAGNKIAREPAPRPAPAPRTPSPGPQQRGLRRYQGTTPASNGAG